MVYPVGRTGPRSTILGGAKLNFGRAESLALPGTRDMMDLKQGLGLAHTGNEYGKYSLLTRPDSREY
jgi:hypothetical protein